MILQHRYVEYSGDKKVYNGPWIDHVFACPDGCFDAGLTLKEARRRKKEFEVQEREDGCSNFEYRIVPSPNEARKVK